MADRPQWMNMPNRSWRNHTVSPGVAEHLLVSTNLSIQQISERFGFCDQFCFFRRFKEKYGETPQRYRRMRLI